MASREPDVLPGTAHRRADQLVAAALQGQPGRSCTRAGNVLKVGRGRQICGGERVSVAVRAGESACCRSSDPGPELALAEKVEEDRAEFLLDEVLAS